MVAFSHSNDKFLYHFQFPLSYEYNYWPDCGTTIIIVASHTCTSCSLFSFTEAYQGNKGFCSSGVKSPLQGVGGVLCAFVVQTNAHQY